MVYFLAVGGLVSCLRVGSQGQRANTPERVTTPIIAELDAAAAAAKEGGDLREVCAGRYHCLI